MTCLTRASMLSLMAFGLGLAAGRSAFAAQDATAQSSAGDTMQPGVGAKRTPHYVGTVYCYACHQELALEFAQTKMGKLFLVKPQNALERLGCEGCHGPASDHAESGGGLGVGGMAEFRIDQGQSIERNNQACLECHDETFWQGGKTHPFRRMACFDCHVVMVRMSPPSSSRRPPRIRIESRTHLGRRRAAGSACGGSVRRMAAAENRAAATRGLSRKAMDWIAFARGPALHWALAIMVFGLCWRLAAFIFSPPEHDLYWARKQFWLGRGHWQIESYVMHVGLLIVLFGFAPHILLVSDLTGITWPGLPIGLVWFAGSVTVIAMVAVLLHRPPDEARSTWRAQADEYFTWTVVLMPLVTGMLAFPHLGGAALTRPYAALLTAHLLSVEFLMIWLPFGRLAHLVLMPVLRGTARTLQLLGVWS